MTSLAKIRANQRNARKSTGPRSRGGKQIAARNSRRHGLTLPVLADPALAPEVAALAGTIARSLTGAEADAAGHALACRIAEAEIDFRRVRAVKLRLFAALEADPGNGALLRQLASLDKYEGRAFSRRTTAVRAFDAARAPARALPERSQRRKASDFSAGWRGVIRYAHRLLTMPRYALGPVRLPQAASWGAMLRPLPKRTQRRNPSDINTQPGRRTTNGKGCVAPRDPVGSPLMVRSAAARPRVSNHDHIPNHKTHPSELTPHVEVET
jgi:hypothetical protein